MKILLKLGPILILLLSSSAIHAHETEAGLLDCKKTNLPEEKLICQNPELLKLDRALSVGFQKWKTKSSENEIDERDWLRSRRKACHVDDPAIQKSLKVRCLEFQYQRRLTSFSLGDTPLEFFGNTLEASPTHPNTPNFRIRLSFSKQKTPEGETKFCLRFIDIYQDPSLVPEQTFTAERENCSPKDKASYLFFEDQNSDGFKDIKIWDAHASAFKAYLYNPHRKAFVPSRGFLHASAEAERK